MNNLNNISPKFREELYETSSIKKFNPGDVILDMDAYVNYIPVVLSGSLKVMRTQEDGREILLYYITPGESCIVSILSGMKQDKSQIRAVVEEKAEILMVSIQKAKEWIRKFPEWTDFIFDLYQKRFEGLLNIVNSVAFQKVDARILQLLHQKAELYESNELVVTHQQIADELGITREAASRVLKQLENEEEIKLSRNKILLL
ncbi:Crp/Fnr family transcriptional regulator [uncultured Chryseobacterium sp.]|uniref:Crp/Fnr family transcriptional regulator n=1 Tax=uncultured Chryseobacterium sp. TaxID=259322 RepID=UPI002611D3DD|nr:Crp/Fnr family transcriptional regulator [uncultured Chryseobacterium sp.]